MLFVAFSLLLFIRVLCVYFLLVQLVPVLSCFSFVLLCMEIWASWIWMDISFPMLAIFFTIISNIFSYTFFFFFSSVTSVHSRETCFPCTALAFMPRIDSHHRHTWDSPVGSCFNTFHHLSGEAQYLDLSTLPRIFVS